MYPNPGRAFATTFTGLSLRIGRCQGGLDFTAHAADRGRGDDSFRGATDADQQVGAGRWALFLTADHGIGPTPEWARQRGVDAGRGLIQTMVRAAGEKAVADAFVTVYPCGEPRPWASNLNVTAAATVANLLGYAKHPAWDDSVLTVD